MRNPYDIQEIIFDNDPIKAKVIKVDFVPKFDMEDYDLMDDKERRKYFDSIKKICRGSFEYKKLINYLRDNMNMNKCSFMENVSNVDSFKIKIHIHHEPFTLEDIVKTVYNKRMRLRQSLDENMVAEEVMYLHYSLLVGLIPLSETVHQLVHNNYLFVPMDKVFGNVEKFIEVYGEYMDPDLKLQLQNVREFTAAYNTKMATNIRLLEKNYIYLDMNDVYQLPSYDSIIQLMNNRINELRGNTPGQVEYKLGDKNEKGKIIYMVREKEENMKVIENKGGN